MYRKRSIIGMLAAVVLLSAATVPTAASVTDWSYHYVCISVLDVGTRTGALDSFDGFDSLLPDIWIDPPAILTWSDLGGTRLEADYRSPLALGQMKNWTIKVGLRQQIVFPRTYSFSWSPGRSTPPTDGPPTSWTASLRLVSIPSGSPYSGPTLWNLTGGQSGSTGLPMQWPGSGLPIYTFAFSVTAIPEPAPVLALCSGVWSLVLLRRRH